MEKKNEILDLSFDFALEIIKLVKYLKSKKEFVLSNQLLRSGTSIGANVSEAQAAQSTKDFISKMSIASKEARETEYWLRLLDKSNYLIEYQKKPALLKQPKKRIEPPKSNIQNHLSWQFSCTLYQKNI